MIINKTPHPVTILKDFIIMRTYPTSGETIRLSMCTVPAGELEDGTPLTRTEFGEAEGMPEFQPDAGIFYIVSQLVKNAFPERTDFLVPTEIVRDYNGSVIGCRSLGI